MVQKIQPRGVIWGAFFPTPQVIFLKQNQRSVLFIYIVGLGLISQISPERNRELGPINDDLMY